MSGISPFASLSHFTWQYLVDRSGTLPQDKISQIISFCLRYRRQLNHIKAAHPVKHGLNWRYIQGEQSGESAKKQNRFPCIPITQSYDTPGWVGLCAQDTDILHTSLLL